MKILIMGLPGSGKTTLASKLVPLLNAKWLNNDEARKAANDWDFSEEGRLRQAKRMGDIAKKYRQEGHYDYLVADYICQLDQTYALLALLFLLQKSPNLLQLFLLYHC